MNKTGILIAGCLLGGRLCYGGNFSSDSIGTTGGQFLSVGAGARALALGGAYTAISDDSSGIYWNPAGLTQIPETSVMFARNNHIADISFSHLAFARKKDNYAFGAALSHMNAGEIQRTDVSGASLGTYNPRDYVGIISLAAKTGDPLDPDGSEFFSAGLNAKILRSSIIEKAEAFAVDAGILARSTFNSGEKTIRFGFGVQNMGSKIKFYKKADSLPLTLKAGLALETSKNLLLAADIIAPKSNLPYVALGLEYKIRVLSGTGVSLRLGGNTLTLNSLKGLNGLSAGAGVKLNVVCVDYAISGFGELGNSQKISLTFNFGREGKEEGAFKMPKNKTWRTAGKERTSKEAPRSKTTDKAAGWSWIWR